MAKKNIFDGVSLSAYEEIFGGNDEEIMNSDSGKEKMKNQIKEVPLSQLHEFKGHPFRVLDDEKMEETVESIREYGVLVPGIARPRPEGGYEILAGHRRCHASKLAGKETMPMIIRDVSNDEATLIMVDSNIQREELLPSEKAKAYSMKYQALKHQGTGSGYTLDMMGEAAGDSRKTVQRYICLSKLCEELMGYVDEGKLGVIQGGELSFLSEYEQKTVFAVIRDMKSNVSKEQATKIKEIAKEGKFTRESVIGVLTVVKPKQRRVTLDSKKLDSYFDPVMTNEDIEKLIIRLLEDWKQKGGEE